MGGRHRVRRILFGVIFVLGISLLSACESRTVDYGDGGTTEGTMAAGNSAKKGVEQFKSASKWKDEWKATDANGKVITMFVEADIALPNTGQMYVVEVEEPVFDEAYKERVAKALFGDATVYYNDLAHYTRAELQEVYDETVEWYNIDDLDEETENRLKAEIEQCEELLETAPDTYTPVDTYDVDKYRGEIDGILYELFFVGKEVGAEFMPTIEQRVVFCVKDMAQICPDECVGMEELHTVTKDGYTAIAGDNLENQYPEEEARRWAEDFVNGLGLGPFLTSGSEPAPLIWTDLNYEGFLLQGYATDGYSFGFGAGVDGIEFDTYNVRKKFDAMSTMLDRKKEGEEKRYDMRAILSLSVASKGLIKMRLDNPIEITEISGAVDMLPLAAIQEIMETEVVNDFDRFRFDYDSDGRIEFDTMELIYFRIRDREHEGRYSYVPTWRLLSKDSNNVNVPDHVRNPILINAIDGSVIDFYDEV